MLTDREAEALRDVPITRRQIAVDERSRVPLEAANDGIAVADMSDPLVRMNETVDERREVADTTLDRSMSRRDDRPIHISIAGDRSSIRWMTSSPPPGILRTQPPSAHMYATMSRHLSSRRAPGGTERPGR